MIRIPRFDGRDRLVVVAMAGLGLAINGVAMISPAAAWITGGVALVAWALWRLH
jgi:hypothetical protein